ncbi:hypothetical protein [Helicovermis profundi]|uniref:Uncharacterized protein n=1 Tax=Helicovermis profundi TaxID=3065157 RepID=A0AAU9EWC0_9FIRM|nr:hypothetical protein HLPR_17210 [Clostridia bacterium S502]
MHKVKRTHIIVNLLVGLLFVIGSLMLKNLVFFVISFFGCVLLFRDGYRQYFMSYGVDEKSVKVYYKDKVYKEITWKNIELVSRTRKNKKWIVVGSFDDLITLKNSIEDLDVLKIEIVKEAKKRKKIFIHETLID